MLASIFKDNHLSSSFHSPTPCKHSRRPFYSAPSTRHVLAVVRERREQKKTPLESRSDAHPPQHGFEPGISRPQCASRRGHRPRHHRSGYNWHVSQLMLDHPIHPLLLNPRPQLILRGKFVVPPRPAQPQASPGIIALGTRFLSRLYKDRALDPRAVNSPPHTLLYINPTERLTPTNRSRTSLPTPPRFWMTGS